MSEAGSLVAGVSGAQSVSKVDFRQIVNELRGQNFDTIRFATYRTSCKLRFVQKKVNLHLVDIWNVIESFRENGLNVVDATSEVKISRTELLLSTIYHNLNKRLPVNQQIDTDRTINLLLSLLLAAYDREDVGKLRVFSIKVALATLCAGKLLDKLRYIFSQISDNSGIMDYHRFSDYLREVLALPTVVFEGPTFGYSEAAVRQCFDPNVKVSVNLFLDTLMADRCPPCLMWLPLLHRMASVEHVFHPVVCDACNRDSFTGFRYKCQRCHNYQLCQDCFWRGRVSGSHTNQHEMKEYSSYKSPTKQLGHSISKSLQCMPTHPSSVHAPLPDRPEQTLDLTNVVPTTPALVHGGLPNQHSTMTMNQHYDNLSMGSLGSLPSPTRSDGAIDDEHKLIARYAAKIAGRKAFPGRGGYGNAPEDSLAQRVAVARLEQKNKEILREIQRLQAMHTASSLSGSMLGSADSGITVELDTLRQRKLELEQRMEHLQDTRRDLMTQLESLMKVLKTQTPREGSPRSPSSLSGVGGEIRSAFRESSVGAVGFDAGTGLPSSVASPYYSLGRPPVQQQSIPGVGAFPHMAGMTQASIPASIGSAGTYQTSMGNLRKPTLQTDLLSAADSITNTMSSLVRELGTEDDEQAENSYGQNMDGGNGSNNIHQENNIHHHHHQQQVQVQQQHHHQQQQQLQQQHQQQLQQQSANAAGFGESGRKA